MKEEDLTALVSLFISWFIYFACSSVARIEKFRRKMEQEHEIYSVT